MNVRDRVVPHEGQRSADVVVCALSAAFRVRGEHGEGEVEEDEEAGGRRGMLGVGDERAVALGGRVGV